jgi:hypothetical protein
VTTYMFSDKEPDAAKWKPVAVHQICCFQRLPTYAGRRTILYKRVRRKAK